MILHCVPVIITILWNISYFVEKWYLWYG